jgi:hypothetical protein
LKDDVLVDVPNAPNQMRLRDLVDQIRHNVVRSMSEIRQA